MSRNTRRVVLKDIVRTYNKHGYLPQSPPTAFGLVRDLDDILSQTKNPNRAADAAARTLSIYDRAMKEHGAVAELACKKGCFYCCTTAVSASLPEIFLIARSFRTQWAADSDFQTRFMSAETKIRGLSVDERAQRRLPCPVLVENACSGYAVRPLACRAYASTSLQACIDSFNLVSDNIPVPENAQYTRMVLFSALRGALAMHGLDDTTYELGHALAIALGDSKSELKWLAGEPLFGGVIHETRQANASATGDILKTVLVAGALGKEMPRNPFFEWPEA